MAVTGPEVMYGAYYPYLYGRGAARSFHHAPHFQYDRLQGAGNGGEAFGGAGVSSGSASSGAQSPASPPHALAQPPRLRTKEEDQSQSRDGGASSESEGECGAACGVRARAQYVSANCVVFTHYSGDVAAVVDEHFARALALDKHKEGVPMVSRNLPASFFNAAAAGVAGCGGVDIYDYDPWHQHYGGYGHAHRHAAEYHAAAHGMGYGGLLLGRGHLHPQYKPDWAPQHAPHLDPAACAPYSYPAVPGLEAQVQDSSKDLYWF